MKNTTSSNTVTQTLKGNHYENGKKAQRKDLEFDVHTCIKNICIHNECVFKNIQTISS